MAAGATAAASHLSAAGLLGLVEHPPTRPVITIPYRRTVSLAGVTVHRSRDLDQTRILERRGVRYTDPLRILTDLAAEMEPDRLALIADAALYKGLVSTAGLEAEIARRGRSGRQGPSRLADLLQKRGLIGGPEPSVLEAQAMRLFRRSGIPVLAREVRVGTDGRYRIDFLIAEGLAVEVDGFAHHWSPEAKAYDDARRNHLRAAGIVVLVYDWRAIRSEPRRVVADIRTAMAVLGAA